MTLNEFVSEPLTQKNRRLMQEKCRHEEIYSSTVAGPEGTFTNSFCLDCGQRRSVSSPSHNGGAAT